MVKPTKSVSLTSSGVSSASQRSKGVRKHRHRSRAGSLLQQWHHRRLKKPVAGSTSTRGQNLDQDQERDKQSPPIMEDETKMEMEGFLNSGRTGRRNAMPSIDNPELAAVTTADLPLDLAKLSCTEGSTAGSSGQAVKDSKQASGQAS